MHTLTDILKGLFEIFTFMLIIAFFLFLYVALCPPDYTDSDPAQTDFDFAVTLAEADRKADKILDQLKFLSDYDKVLAGHVQNGVLKWK